MLGTTLLLAACQSDLKSLVTYETRAKDVTQILADLKNQTSAAFEARGISNTPLVVSVKDMSLDRLMARLAEVTDAKWEREGDTHVLVRTDRERREAQRKEAILRGKRLAEWITTRKAAPLVKWSDTDINDRIQADLAMITNEIRKIRQHNSDLRYGQFGKTTSAAEPLLDAILAKIDPTLLGGVQLNRMQVFSNRPGPGQKALGINLSPHLGTYMFNRRRLGELASRFPATIDEMSISTPYSSLAKPLPGMPKIDLAVSRFGNTNGVYAQLFVWGESIVDTAELQVDIAPERAPELPLSKGSVVQLQPDSAAILPHLGQERSGMLSLAAQGVGPVSWPMKLHPSPPPKELRILQRPAEFEPMSFFASDWILSTASDLKADVVAFVPDNAIGPLFRAVSGSRSLSAIWKLQGGPGIDASLQEGCLIVKPTAFARADRYRVDRRALQNLLTKVGADALPTLEDVFAYAEKLPEAHYDSNVDVLWMSAVDPNLRVLGPLTNLRGRAMCRFASSWFPLALSAEGVDFPVARMTEVQKGRLVDWMAASQYGPAVRGGMFSNSDIPPETKAIPEVVLPDLLALHRRSAVGILGETSSGIVLQMSPTELGMRRGIPIGNLVNIDSTQNFQSFRTYISDSFLLRIQARSSSSALSELGTLRGFRNLSSRMSFDDLPADIRSEVDDAASKSKEIRAQVGRSAGPPPPQ